MLVAITPVKVPRPTGLSPSSERIGPTVVYPMDLGLIDHALKKGQVNFVAGNSTEGFIKSLDLVVLQNARQYFSPHEAVPVIRQDILKRHLKRHQTLTVLGGKISEEEMQNRTGENRWQS